MSDPNETPQGDGSPQNWQGSGSSSYQPGQGGQHPGQTGGFTPAQPSGAGNHPQPGGYPGQGGYVQPGQPASYPQPGGYQPGPGGPYQPGAPSQGGYGQPDPYARNAGALQGGHQPQGFPPQAGYQQPGQPYAGAPHYPTPGGPGPSSSAPVGGSGGGRNKRLFAILGGILALLLILGLIIAAVHSSSGKKSNSGSGTASSAGSGGSASGGGDESTGPGVVQAYFSALAAGDATKALSYAKTAPTDTTFLTDAVLKQAMKNSPITDVKASSTDPKSSFQMVSYSYQLGGRQVNDQVEVTKEGDAFKMQDVAANVSVYRGGTGKLKELFNGVAVNGDKLYMFPGTYDVTSDNPYITYGKGKFTVDSPNTYASTSDLDPALTADGQKAYVAAAKAKLADCVKQKTLQPAGCGFGNTEPPGTKVVPNSITWKIKNGANALDTLKGDLDSDDPTAIKDYVNIDVTNTAKASDGSDLSGDSYIIEVDGVVGPKGITVTFDN